jgi:hypothetical protein
MLGALLCTAVILPAQADAPTVKPGEWSYSVKTEMPGMPFAMPPISFKHCITEQEVADGKAYQQDPKNKDCKMENLKQTKSSVSYDMVCTGKNAMTGHYDVTFGNDSMIAKGSMSMQGGQTVNNTTEAKRIGDCK